jgi:hypothetical protein
MSIACCNANDELSKRLLKECPWRMSSVLKERKRREGEDGGNRLGEFACKYITNF